MRARDLELAGEGFAGLDRRRGRRDLGDLVGGDRQGEGPDPGVTVGVGVGARCLVGPRRQGVRGRDPAR